MLNRKRRDLARALPRYVGTNVLVTGKTICERGDTLGVENLNMMLEMLYREGGNADIIYITLEQAREAGLIGPWEYQWRRLLRWFRTGTWRPSVPSGAPSAPRTRGTGRTA